MEENLQNSNMPQEGTPEYEQMMREAYGEEFEYQKRATFLPRFFATLIDLVLITVLQFGAYSIIYDVNMLSMSFWSSMGTDPEAAQLYQDRLMPLSFVLTAIYFFMELLLAASPGKLMLGLRIANLDGNPATTMQLLIRVLYKNSGNLIAMLLFAASLYVAPYTTFISVLGFAVFIGFLFALSDKRQALQDIIAKTAVYKTSNLNLEN